MNRACNRQKCMNPCPGICASEAECSVVNHNAICVCPPGTIGDAFHQCVEVIERRNQTNVHLADPCYPTPCGINTICRQSNNHAICECIPGYFGNAFGTGCHPECTFSTDCSRDKACINNKCADPCPGVCGYGAQCHTVNHSPICSCIDNMVGDPFTACKPADPIVELCNPSPCRPNGICHVINGRAECTYPECIINDDCTADRACFNQRCSDPCINACGTNAICRAVNHKPICSCPSGYVGSPLVQCLVPKEMDIPHFECIRDDDCTNNKACINQQCRSPCAEANVCASNADCYVQLHRAICVCHDGYAGNGQFGCHKIGCRSDSECATTQACVNEKCIDACQRVQCGQNAMCRPTSNHKAECYCLDGYRGNPFIRCDRPECISDSDCSYDLACKNEKCQDPCNCGVGADCRVYNHRGVCQCPPGYTGDAYQLCTRSKSN